MVSMIEWGDCMSEKIKPFRIWTQAILPLVYDDSLSYYELLCKVIDKVNDTIELANVNNDNTISLKNAFDEFSDSMTESFDTLQGFVDSYFDNLDVQTEINNKLDEMALDGSLTELISPFVDSEIAEAVAEWLEENITPTTPAIDTSLLVSGAGADSKTVGDKLKADVAPAYSASDTYSVGDYRLYDHTLYKCNTPISTPEVWTASHWTAVNMTDEISVLNNAIKQKSTAEIPCSIRPITNKLDLTLSDYSGKKVFISNRNLLPQFTAMTDHGVTCVKNDDGSISLSGTADGTAVITITVNEMPNLGAGTYALSCGNSVSMGDNNTYINVAIDGSYAAIYARFNSIDGKTTFTVPEGSRVTAIRIRISSGVVIPSGFKCYPQIVEGTDFIDFIPHEGSILNPVSGEVSGYGYVGYTYICAQSGVSGTVTYDVSKIDSLQTEINAIDGRVSELEQKESDFYGKKIVCFGDSLVGNFPEPTDYPSMIAQMTGAIVYNAGFGGCCMSDNGQVRKDFTMCRLADSIVAGDFTAQRNSGVSITYAGTSIDYVPDRISMLEDIDWTEIDYITIAYGTNDWNSNYALDNENDLDDTTTYLGAFRYSVEKLLTAYPNLKILVITPLWRWWDTNTGMPSEIQADYIDANDYAKGTGYKLWQYGDALADVAKLYHIPTLNIFWECMMTKQNRLEYFNANDGTHPKESGRYLMAQIIKVCLESKY